MDNNIYIDDNNKNDSSIKKVNINNSLIDNDNKSINSNLIKKVTSSKKEDYNERFTKSTNSIINTATYNDKFIEELLEKIGYGSYQLRIILIVFFVISIEGIHLTLMSSMIIPLKGYFNTTSFGIETLSGIIFIGVGIGSLSIGLLSNNFNRDFTLKMSLALTLFSHLITIIFKNIIIFSICRFFIGYGVGISVPLTLNVLCEYLPIKARSYTLTAVWASFGLGQAFVAIFMLIFMPNFEVYQVKNVFLFLWIYSLIIVICVFLFFIDSPRNLILTKKENEGIKILENMTSKIKGYENMLFTKSNEEEYGNVNILNNNDAKTKLKNIKKYVFNPLLRKAFLNYIKSGSNNQIEETEESKAFNNLSDDDIDNNVDISIKHNKIKLKDENLIKKTDSPFTSIFKKPFIKTSVLLTAIWIINSILTYGPLLILTPTLKLIRDDSNNSNIIINIIFLSTATFIVSYILPLFTIIKSIGLIKLFSLFYIIAMIFNIFILANIKNIALWITIYNMFLGASFNLSSSYTSCIYPTKIRDYAIGFFYFCTRIGGFVSQYLFLWLFNMHYMLPYYTMILLILICIIVTFFMDIEPSDEALDKEFDIKK